MNTQALLSVLVCLAIDAGLSPASISNSQISSNARRRVRSQKATASSSIIRSLERIGSRDDFDRLARVYYRGRFYALPHVMFVIDRRARDRVYYVNSNVYKFHKDFVNATYLSLERGRAFYENNYVKPDRRFILGTIAFQTAAARFTFEFW
jgi:hypothetical protein